MPKFQISNSWFIFTSVEKKYSGGYKGSIFESLSWIISLAKNAYYQSEIYI